MLLNFISGWMTIGAIGLSIITLFVFAAQVASVLSAMKSGRLTAPPSDTFLKILSYLSCFVLLISFIMSTVGTALTLTTPGKKMELAFSIASLATIGLATILLVVEMVTVLFSSGEIRIAWVGPAQGYWIGFAGYDPFAMYGGGGSHPLKALGFSGYLVGWLTIGHLVCLILYQLAVGGTQRDRRVKSGAFLAVILVPSIIAGSALLNFILRASITAESPWVIALIGAFYGGGVITGLVFHTLLLPRTRGVLLDAD
jgi:hypothetical protein